jgi:hypothetical protein
MVENLVQTFQELQTSFTVDHLPKLKLEHLKSTDIGEAHAEASYNAINVRSKHGITSRKPVCVLRCTYCYWLCPISWDRGIMETPFEWYYGSGGTLLVYLGDLRAMVGYF